MPHVRRRKCRSSVGLARRPQHPSIYLNPICIPPLRPSSLGRCQGKYFPALLSARQIQGRHSARCGYCMIRIELYAPPPPPPSPPHSSLHSSTHSNSTCLLPPPSAPDLHLPMYLSCGPTYDRNPVYHGRSPVSVSPPLCLHTPFSQDVYLSISDSVATVYPNRWHIVEVSVYAICWTSVLSSTRTTLI